jgi:outer membrane immunogenic protein
VPLFTWTGFYLGINGGGAFGSSTWDTAGSINPSGGLVGGTIGYNYQISHFVVGAEADIDWASISGTTTTAACPAGCKTGDSWLSTVRGRVGYAADRFLPFVTGGAALGNINATTAGLTTSATNAGWTLGAGVEFAFSPSWSAKAEYLYVNLGKFNCGLNCGAPTDNVSFTANIVRGGINYRF